MYNLFLKCFYDLISYRIEKVLSKQINEKKNKVKDCFRKWLRELRVSHMHTGRLDKNSPPLSFISDLVQSRLSDKKKESPIPVYIYVYTYLLPLFLLCAWTIQFVAIDFKKPYSPLQFVIYK